MPELTGPTGSSQVPGNENGTRDVEPSVAGSCRCRFEVAPPRHFLYPAILLLLAEQPRHGYRLMDALLGLGFGPMDRPGVYRALADLEGDGLLDSWLAAPTAGSTRHVYRVTTAGAQALDRWMRVVAEERDGLDRVLFRYLKVAPNSG